jgi:molybdopterin converting factor small subunit
MASAWGLSWGRAWGNSWGSVEGAVQPPVIAPGGGRGLDYLSWWERELRRILKGRKKPKKKLPPKKQELVDDLEEALVQLREQVEERQETDNYARNLRNQVLESARFLNEAYATQVNNKRIQHEIAVLEAYLRERDDEEALILAIN